MTRHLLPDLEEIYIPTDEDNLHRLVATLQREVAQLQATVALLVEVNPDLLLPEDCRKRECNFYRHYLQYRTGDNDRDMAHADFHVAEKEHLAHVQNCRHNWENGPCQSCMYYEKRTRI